MNHKRLCSKGMKIPPPPFVKGGYSKSPFIKGGFRGILAVHGLACGYNHNLLIATHYIYSKTTEAPVPDRWAPLEQLLKDGVSQGVFTGAVALVGFKGRAPVGGGGGPGLPGPGRGGRDPGYESSTWPP